MLPEPPYARVRSCIRLRHRASSAVGQMRSCPGVYHVSGVPAVGPCGCRRGSPTAEPPSGTMTVFGSGMAHANATEGIVVPVRMRQGRLAPEPHRQEHLPLFGEGVGTKTAATLLYENAILYTMCVFVKRSYNNELRCYTKTRFRILTGIRGREAQGQCGAIPYATWVGFPAWGPRVMRPGHRAAGRSLNAGYPM